MRKSWVVFLIGFFVLLISPSAFAATCSFSSPVNNENITTSPYTLNITCLPSSSDGSIYNVTFRYSSDGSSYTTITTVQNTTDNQTIFTYSWDWTNVADGVYYINATGYEYNNTDLTLLSTGSDQVSNIGLDDTSPTVTINTYPTAVKYGTNFDISGSCSDTGFNDECSCTFYQQKGFEHSDGATMTVSGSDISYSFKPTQKGFRKWWVTCTDAHGFSTTTSKIETVVSKAGSGIVVNKPVESKGKTIRTGISSWVGEVISNIKNLINKLVGIVRG